MINKKCILVVEDEPDLLHIVVFRLKNAGYNVISAQDGKTGLEMAKKEKPCLILLDLKLPLMDGVEVCKQLKADAELKSIPVIFLSASPGKDIADKIKDAGADDYMQKSFDTKEFLDKLTGYLR